MEKERTTVYLTKETVKVLKMYALTNEMTMSEAVTAGIYMLNKNMPEFPKTNPFEK